MAVKRIRFLSEGFRNILTSPEVESIVAAEARRQAARKEAETGEEYEVARLNFATSRVVYTAKPKGGRRPNLDHETWMNVVWPKVGGPKWRPHR